MVCTQELDRFGIARAAILNVLRLVENDITKIDFPITLDILLEQSIGRYDDVVF